MIPCLLRRPGEDQRVANGQSKSVKSGASPEKSSHVWTFSYVDPEVIRVLQSQQPFRGNVSYLPVESWNGVSVQILQFTDCPVEFQQGRHAFIHTGPTLLNGCELAYVVTAPSM